MPLPASWTSYWEGFSRYNSAWLMRTLRCPRLLRCGSRLWIDRRSSAYLPGTPRDILATIDSWMQRDECLQVQRRFADRITWEPQRGLFGKLRRTVNVSGHGYYLMDAGQVSATVLAVDASRVVVRLDADIHASRARRVGIGGFVTAMGAAASGIVGLGLVIAHLPLFIAAGAAVLPFAGSTFAGYKVARTHRGVLSSVQLALEQILDRLEHGEFERSAGLLGALASRARLPRG